MNKYEREFVAEEGFATRLQTVAEGHRTRSWICLVAMLMCGLYVIAMDDNTVAIASGAVAAVSLFVGAVYNRIMYGRNLWSSLESSSRATSLMCGVQAIHGETEIAWNIKTGHQTLIPD
jgi:hypothetical protein